MHTTLRCFFTLIIVMFCITESRSQGNTTYDPNTLISQADLKKDLQVLKDVLTELDPALYRYRTKKQVDSMFNAAAGSISKPMTEDAFKNGVVLPAVVFLKDLHFVVYPSVAAEKYLQDEGNYFPFDIRIVDGHMYIWRNFSDNQEIAGKQTTEILKINGVNTAAITGKLKNYIVADGESVTTKKTRDIEESFRTYYGIAYGKPREFELQIRELPTNKTSTVNIAAKSWNDIHTLKEKQYPTQPELPRLEINNAASIATLVLHSFDPKALSVTDQYLEKFIDSSFTAIRNNNIRSLILDLRGNYGGRMNFGAQVYAHLTDSAYKYIDRVEVRYPHIFESIIHTSLGRSFLTNTYGMRYDKTASGDSIYTWDTYQWTFEQKPAATPFTGQLYVLTDGYTLSTTGLLASMIRGFRDSTIFIGEETGGAYEGCSGNLPFVTLPRSQIRIHFPIRKFVSPAAARPKKNKGFNARGVIPDIEMHPSIDQMMSGDDVIYQKAVNLSKQ